jgi:N-acyl homoserine lactone hydrolase
MAVVAVPKPLGHPLPGGHAGATVRLRPLLGGEIACPPGFFASDHPGGRIALLRAFFSRRSSAAWAPVPAFLLEHPDAGHVLVDTAMHASVAMVPADNLGAVGARLNRFRGVGEGIPGRLRELGVDPRNVRTVVMTHLHSDHASGVVEFPNATFVVDAREWAAASAGGATKGYHHPQFDHAFDWRTVDFDGQLSQGLSPFGRSVDLFGDGSVRLLSTPGHTLGHQSVLVRLRGRDALLVGDAAYTRETIGGDALPLVWADEHLFRRSLREIRRFVASEPAALVIPGHDPDAWAELDEVYD